MKRDEINRRDFHKLTSAALGGLVAGSMIGCGGGEAPKAGGANKDDSKKDGEAKDGGEKTDGGEPKDVAEGAALLMVEPHVCRGLNTCKEKGKGGKNACAGQGACATAKEHSCHFANECKGQGGCQGTAGTNACAKMGNCAVPLQAETWKAVRAKFESQMKEKGKEVGAAPDA